MLSNNQQLPAAPNYQNLTTQQAALANQLNRPNQVTPYGTQSWNTLPSGQSQVTNTLSPNEQTLLGQKEQTGISLGNTGQGLAGQMAQNYSSPLNYNSAPAFQTNVGLGDVSSQLQNASDAVYKQAKMNLDPQWAQADSNIRTQLINAGIPQNSDAWDKAMAAHELNKTQAYSNAQYQATQQGMQLQNQLFGQANVNANLNNAGRQQSISEANYLRGLPASELTGLNAATPVTGAPTSMSANGGFGQFTPAAVPNLMGAAGQSYQDALNAFGSQNATANNNANMWGNIAKTAISAYPALKTMGTDAANAYQNYFGGSPSSGAGVAAGYQGTNPGSWQAGDAIDANSAGQTLASDGTMSQSSLPANYWSQDASGAGTMGTATDAAPAGAGSFGGYDGSGTMDASGTLGSTAAQSAAADPGFMDYLGNAWDSVKGAVGGVGAVGSVVGMLSGQQDIQNPLTAVQDIQAIQKLYQMYQAATGATAAGAAGTGAAAAGGEAAAAGAGAAGAEGAGAGSAAAGAGMGALGGGIVALGAYFGEKDTAKQIKEQYGHMSETMNALQSRGIDMRALDPSNWYKPLDELPPTTTIDGNTGQRNMVEQIGDKKYGIDNEYIDRVLGGNARAVTGRSAFETARDLLLHYGLTQGSPYSQQLAQYAQQHPAPINPRDDPNSPSYDAGGG